MNCKQAYQFIVLGISSKDFQEHLKECPACSELNKRVNNTMGILDEFTDPSERFVEAILQKKGHLQQPTVKRNRFAGYLQLAVLLVAGIFIGHLLGKHASFAILNKKAGPSIENYEMYPFNTDYSGYGFRFFKLEKEHE